MTMINLKNEIKFDFKEGNPALGAFQVGWLVPSDFPYFQGHFPDLPILPAVAILDVSTEILRSILQLKRIQLRSIKTCKFKQPITPKTNVEIRFQKSSHEEWSIEWLISGPEQSLNLTAHLVLSLSLF